jgi:hypothetical protein
VEVQVGWNRLERDWIKLNTDDTGRHNDFAGCGVLLKTPTDSGLVVFCGIWGGLRSNAYLAVL